MGLFEPEFLAQLENSDRILIAGAGGGYDVFCGLPLYFEMVNKGKTVFLANLSFARLEDFKGEWITETMMKVDANTKGKHGDYFPEWYLSQWLNQHGYVDTPIYAFDKTGVMPLYQNYLKLQEELKLDAIVLVDGGTDSLMRGDEDGLGTPVEDYVSLSAVSILDVPTKLLVCLGFGVDHFHGVSNDLTLEAIAELTRENQFLGSMSLLNTMPVVQKYIEATQFVFEAMPNLKSIVSSSIISAIEGRYGNHHTIDRTKGSELWINPLMAMYWFFDLDSVAHRILMLDRLYMTEYADQVLRAITVFRRTALQEIRQRQNIPN